MCIRDRSNLSNTHISGISVDSQNRIWFDDSLGQRVGYFDPSTKTYKTVTLSSQSAHPHDGLAVDSNNNTWFTELFDSKLGEVLAGTL